ncbi:DUF2752 domain-containing protein [bacterium]|nr:DUF2752 domain-containing protein [bacterium]
MPAESPQQEPTPVPPAPLPIAVPVRPGNRLKWGVRVGLVAVAVSLASVFGVAAYLNPYGPDGAARTMATHTQLGLPQCNMVALTGHPCPTCGMTTSFALLVRGDVRASLNANWVGTVLAVGWAGLLVWAVACLIAGRLWFIRPGRGEAAATAGVALFLVLALGRWAAILWEG